MALEHSILKASIGDDGRSIVVSDATIGYGVDPNPFRSELAWLLLVVLNTGEEEKVVPGVSYLLNTGTEDAPVFEPSTPLAGSFAYIPLDEDGRYEIKSVLVHRESALAPTAGNTALNLLYVDEQTYKLKRVVEAHVIADPSGENTGNYAYVFEELASIEAAIEEGYPTVILPVLQLLDRRQALAKGNLSYLSEGNFGSKAATLQCTSAYSDDEPTYLQQREMCFELLYQILGAEANFACNQIEKLLVNLRESGQLALKLMEG